MINHDRFIFSLPISWRTRSNPDTEKAEVYEDRLSSSDVMPTYFRAKFYFFFYIIFVKRVPIDPLSNSNADHLRSLYN